MDTGAQERQTDGTTTPQGASAPTAPMVDAGTIPSRRHVWHDPAWLRGQLAAVGVLLLLAACKLVLLLLDPHVRLFMGDSATYLFAAITHATPSDRSFTYPILIDQTAGRSGSLISLLLLQTCIGIAAAATLFSILRRGCGVRGWLALLAAVLLALDPSQLFYERMIMTETVAAFCLLAGVWIVLQYLRSARPFWLVFAALCSTLLVSLRIGMLPLALGLAPIGPLLLAALRGRRRVPYLEWPRFFVHLGVAVFATWFCHHQYQAWYGARAGTAPMYLRDAGIFRLGLVVPLLKPQHFEGSGVDPDILREVRLPLADPHLREAHIWQPDGLIAALRAHAGARADEIAERLAERAVADDPLGLLRLGLATFADYFDPALRTARLRSDLGAGELPDDHTLHLLRKRFRYQLGDLPRTPTLVSRYFEHTALWLVICLFALPPIALLMLWRNGRYRPAPALLIALLACGLFVGELLCAHIVSFRYLHPFPPLFLLCLALLMDRPRVHFRMAMPRPAVLLPQPAAT